MFTIQIYICQNSFAPMSLAFQAGTAKNGSLSLSEDGVKTIFATSWLRRNTEVSNYRFTK